MVTEGQKELYSWAVGLFMLQSDDVPGTLIILS